jgi:hypothetical protein
VHRDPIQPLSAERLPLGGLRAPPGCASPSLWLALVLAIAGAALAPVARAEGRLAKMRGYMEVGYAKLLSDPSPGGSFSMGAGVDYPVGDRFRIGLAFGYELLGTKTVERGSFAAEVDYSMVEVLALTHWTPTFLGPLHRITLGPGIFNPQGILNVQAGGAGFSDLAVNEWAPGFALDGTLIQGHVTPVRVGLETGIRVAYLKGATWTTAQIRLAFHY